MLKHHHNQQQYQYLSSASSTLSSSSNFNSNYTDRAALKPLINEIFNVANNYEQTSSLSNLSNLNFNNNTSNHNTLNRSSATKSRENKHNVNTLIKFLIEAIQNFIKQSTDLANDYPELNKELTKEIDNIIDKGNKTFEASKQFAKDQLNAQKRKLMIDSSKELLNSVGRLLAIADSIDAHLLNKLTDSIQMNLSNMKNAFAEQDLMNHYLNYRQDLKDLLTLTGRRVKDFTNPVLKNEFASARCLLAKQSPYLLSASKIVLNHPRNEYIDRLHSQIYSEAFSAIDTIQGIITNRINSDDLDIDDVKKQNLFNSLIEIEKKFCEMNPGKCKEEGLNKLDIEIKMETSLKNLAKMTIHDSNRKKKITSESNELKASLIDLFKSIESFKNGSGGWDIVDDNINEYTRKSKKIRSQVRKAVAELFVLDKDENVNYLIEASLSVNNNIELKSYQDIFFMYGNKLIESSLMACSLSNNIEGVQIVEMATLRLKSLITNLIDSTNILNSFKQSTHAMNNMELFRNSWIKEAKILRLAVDDILSINDVLSVCEKSLLDNINGCISAINELNLNSFDQHNFNSMKLINRICEVTESEINNYESCEFIDKVNQNIILLKNSLFSNFKRSSDYVIESFNYSPIRDPNENDFIEASRLVYDSVRDLRNSLLMIPQEDFDNLVDFDDHEFEQVNNEDNFKQNQSGLNYKNEDNFYELDEEEEEEENLDENSENRPPLSNEQREQLKKQFNSFRKEKNNFDREVLKWDDKSNDIIVLSKEMCVIMMDMTNFTRKKGPYQNTNDILNAARKISIIGSRLEKLCRELADQCPESQSKRELLNYLNLLPLFCNQLNIGVKVKENIIFPDSASSLIISAKNLMNAVISVVKYSYVASTKYVNKTSDKKPIVQWKMKPPELKPLVNINKSNEVTGLIRKGAVTEAKFAPVKTLSQFQL